MDGKKGEASFFCELCRIVEFLFVLIWLYIRIICIFIDKKWFFRLFAEKAEYFFGGYRQKQSDCFKI